MKKIISPLTKSTNIEFVKALKVNRIISDYKKYNINVSSYFKGIKEVEVYKCLDSGYKFYYPFNLSGDSAFYEHFQEFDWYYMPWKWEHEITLNNYIKTGDLVLEVGCAQGAFLKEISTKKNLNLAVGLELNETAEQESKDWKIINKTVQSYAKTNAEKFDVVCSYQVLEHISDVRSFLEAKIKCLKKGGTLVISVPNNDSFIKDSENCLNKPPHHMGLWSEESLRSLESIFPIKVLKIHIEELQKYHIENYIDSIHYSKYSNILIRKAIRKINKTIGYHKKLINKVNSNRQKLMGHTILVSYQKL